MFITFLPEGRRCRIRRNETILETARRNGVAIDSSCHGTRCCGRCRVRVAADEREEKLPAGEPLLRPADNRERMALSPAERNDGWHLACLSIPRHSIFVTVPSPARPLLIPTADGERLPGFDCNHAGSEEIPPFVIRKFGASYWDAYQYAPLMSAAASLIADSNGDPVCKLPFCVTIEAGAFGAEIIFPEAGHLPLPGGYRFHSVQELVDLPDIDFSKGRIAEVLRAIRLLHAVGRPCVLKVEAPFTVLSMLMDSMVLFRGLRKERNLIETAMAKIRRNLVRYIGLAFEAGAEMISYADPSGVVEFVGPKIFREVSGRETVRLLKEVAGLRPGGIVHVCGKTSTSLEYMHLCTFETYELTGKHNFAEALLSVYDRHKVSITGHNCILVTAVPIQHQKVSFLHFPDDPDTG